MTRYFFLFINIFPLLFLINSTELKKEELKVEIIAPERVEAGASFDVEIKFTGGNVKQFAKYIDILPAGFEAEEVEMGSATFTADNGQVKILWIDFPQDQEVKVKYKVKALANAPAALELGGKFSYLENNEKKVYSTFKKTVQIGGEAMASASTQEAPAEIKVAIERRLISSRGNVHKVELTVRQTGLDGFAKIQEFVPLGASIEKGEVQNAAYSYVKNKVKFVWMAVPNKPEFKVNYFIDLTGANSQDIKSITGEFAYLDNDVSKKLSIDWVEGEPVEVLAANSSTEESEPQETESSSNDEQGDERSNSGESSSNNSSESSGVGNGIAIAAAASEGGNTAQEEPESTEQVVEEEEVAMVEESSSEEAASEETSTEEAATTEEEMAVALEETSAKEEETSAASEEQAMSKEEVTEEEEEIAVVPTPVKEEEAVTAQEEESAPMAQNGGSTLASNGVQYRVQIAAGKRVVGADYFKARHQFEQNFNVENHQGWVKYTTGSHQDYKAARDSREEINAAGHKFDGPFVTAYSNGERVTVQEALMITNQKWFK